MPTRVWDQTSRYGAVAASLHWLIAAAIIANIYIGLEMSDLPRSDPAKFELFSLHKSIGLTVLVISIFRVVWRLMNPVPPPPRGLQPWMRISGRAMQHLFYVLIVAIPLAGWLLVSSGSMGHGTPVFGLFDWPAFPWLSEMTRSVAHPYHEFFDTAHVWMAWAMIVLVPLHILAALYHHFIRGDNVLIRMLPGVRLRSGV